MCKLFLGRHSSLASQLQANTWAEASLPNAMELSYLETQDTMTTDQQEMPAATARPKPKRMCQVPGCTADLEAIGKPYCCMKRICPVHMKADVIPMSYAVLVAERAAGALVAAGTGRCVA
ncbi:hypothetical protein OEZ85_007800 [Tetradesmus obliquus]|uniref:Uncharacterized protein n=1 Tax=Tetradesmus obliquus TaxID=3088 RepID=A0ABY8TJ81_TETOB|nr:hypothetical protein OEZ85_007800 [Tetradesmus obliquus]